MATAFLEHFELITGPRIERCKKHTLIDILLLAISVVLSGAEGWEEIENFGHVKLDWLKQYGTFKKGIPRHDTIVRVICRLKADEIEHAFQSWISYLSKSLEQILLPLMARLHDVHLQPKIEKVLCILSVHGVANKA